MGIEKFDYFIVATLFTSCFSIWLFLYINIFHSFPHIIWLVVSILDLWILKDVSLILIPIINFKVNQPLIFVLEAVVYPEKLRIKAKFVT